MQRAERCAPPVVIRAYARASVVLSRLNARQRLVGVEGRRRRQRPLERGGAGAPGIVARASAADEVGVEHADEEHERAERR